MLLVKIYSLPIKLEHHAISVANAAVYPPNWATLKFACRRSKNCWAGDLKMGLLFVRLPAAALFSSNVPISCQFREFLSLINVQEHSFHQFQGLWRPREQSILIIHFMRKLKIYLLFRPIGWFWLFYGWKAPKFGKLGVWLLDKHWATLKADLRRFGALKFWQHCMQLSCNFLFFIIGFPFTLNILSYQGGVSLRCSYEPLVGTQLAKSSQRTDRSHLQFVNLFH